MRYVEASQGSVYNAKILGTYEAELHEVLRSLPSVGFGHCLDIGAGEGFYAVGLARLLRTKVTCYELDERGQQLIRDVARLNEVAADVDVRGGCHHAELIAALEVEPTTPTLLVCDVECFERVLLDPFKVPALLRCHVLVEIHDCFEPGTGQELEERFHVSHTIHRIDAREREAEDFPTGLWWSWLIPGRLKRRLMREWRPPGMYWLWMTPNRTAK